MIQQEYYMTRQDGVELIETYSDLHKYIRLIETGRIYDLAIDVSPVQYTYEETNEDIEDNGVE